MNKIYKLDKNKDKINSFAFKLLKRGNKLAKRKKLKVGDGYMLCLYDKITRNYKYQVDFVKDTRILDKPFISVFAFKKGDFDYFYGLRQEVY